MRTTLGNAGDYAVRSVFVLSLEPPQAKLKAREIAERAGVPAPYLPQILGRLIKAGLLTSVAGPEGGYSLAAAPSEISVRAVVEAAEGPILSDICVLRGGPCGRDGNCVLHRHWEEAQMALIQRLEETTFEDLCSEFTEVKEVAI